MKCNKCGEEVREGQAFCLNCGTALNEVPELSDIEQELADTIDSFFEDEDDVFSLDDSPENESQEKENEFDFDDMEVTHEFSLNELQMAVNAKQKEAAEIADKKKARINAEKKRRREEQRKKEQRKKAIRNTIIVLAVLAIVAIGGVIGFQAYQSSQKARGDERSQEYYIKGSKYFEGESYAAALREFLTAEEYAVSTKQKEKVKSIIWQTYINIGNREDDIAIVLEELIELNPYELDYYRSLIEIYQSLGKTDKIDALFASIEDKDIYDTLIAYKSQIPEVNYEDGTYNQTLKLELTSIEGSTIYYTLRKDKVPLDPTRQSNVYSGPITIDEEGVWYFKAIAISSGNSVSGVLNRTYTVDFGIPDAPVVAPTRGNYTGTTEISVESPSEIDVYYTIDGEAPTLADTKYEGPFNMEWGNHIYKFAAINEQGFSSEVVSVIYNCALEQTYDYEDTVELLKEFLYDSMILESVDGTFANGNIAKFSYVDTPIIGNVGFYLIKMQYLSVDEDTGEETIISDVDYAVEFDTGAIALLTAQEDGTYEIEAILKDDENRLKDEDGKIIGN